MKTLRFHRDTNGDIAVSYRGKEVGMAYAPCEYREWTAEFFPRSGRYTVETSQRSARQWLREQAEDYDLETWYALQTGAKEL